MRSPFRAVLIAIVSVALIRPARAESLDTAAKQIYTGIAVVAAGIGVLIVVLVVRHKNKKITGCVNSGANGMSLTDERDNRTYTLSGDPTGVKPGERMTLEGKRRKESGKTLVFEARRVNRDFGVCQP